MPLILGTNSIKDTGYDVANSCRFNDGSSDHLKRTIGSNGSKRTFTFSAWIKRGELSSYNPFFGHISDSSNDYFAIGFNNSDQIFAESIASGNNQLILKPNRLFRDVSAWYHVVVKVDTTQATESNRAKMYINGVEETSFATQTIPSQNSDIDVNVSGEPMVVGGMYDPVNSYFDGYMAEVVFIDGTAYDPTSFGEFDSDSNIWKPKDVSGLTFGTNGFYLDFENNQTAFIDSSSNARAITVSGNTNHSFTQAKFNESSIYFDGTNDSLDIADSSDFDFGTGNFTFEFWVYKTGSGKMAIFETRPNGGNDHGFNLEFDASNKFSWYDASISGTLPTDPNAITLNTWTHYACVRNGTTFTMYKNGTSVGTPLTGDSSSQSSDGTPTIGESSAGSNDFQGYLDEIRLSNTARYTGNFTAPTSPFTSDSDTVLLIQSKASNLIGADVSGQGNHFSSSGLTAIDQSISTPTNIFATWNPLWSQSNGNVGDVIFSEGNLKTTTSANYRTYPTTIGFSSGKWYWEIKRYEDDGSNDMHTGVMSELATPANTATWIGSQANGWVFASDSGSTYTGGTESNTGYSSAGNAGDIVQVAFNADDGKIYFGVNGTWQNSGNPATGTNPAYTGLDTSLFYFPCASTGSDVEGNFGSPSYSISSGNTDADGYGNFEYSVPSGYYALNTKNLAEYG